MSKECKCEHWQQCPVCMPHRFDKNGHLLPPETTPLQAARIRIEELERERDTAWAQAHRLALELECLIMDTKDNAVVSKWWDSAHEALEEWRKFCHEDIEKGGV